MPEWCNLCGKVIPAGSDCLCPECRQWFDDYLSTDSGKEALAQAEQTLLQRYGQSLVASLQEYRSTHAQQR